MTEKTVYCEECVEDIPNSEVYFEEGRLYCKQCGSEVESPDKDIFEQIEGNQETLIFRDDVDENLDDEGDEEEEMEEVTLSGAEEEDRSEENGPEDNENR